MSELYPWPGKYQRGKDDTHVAVVTLDEPFSFHKEKVAIWGPMKTENLGIEKVVANVISNPHIRYLVVCGEEIRGHKSGGTLIALHKNGIEENGKIEDAPGAVPYIENISEEAVERFREQVTVIDMLGETDIEKIKERIDELEDPGSFGEPYIAVSIKKKERSRFEADLALHASVQVSPWGDVSPMEE